MRLLSLFAVATPLALALSVEPRQSKTNKALYFLDSDPNGASVVALSIGRDGTLSNPIRTSTGGLGALSIGPNGPAGAVTLNSQDGLTRSGDWLFAVNFGSDTLSLLQIPSKNPQHPLLVGQPINTGGDAPNSVAYSPRHRLACVLNSGRKSGYQCFSVSRSGKMAPAGDFVPLPVENQTVPQTAPINSVSDIRFSPSESYFMLTIKDADRATPGYVYVVPITKGRPGKPVISRSPDLLIAYGFSFLSDRQAWISDPFYGDSLVDIASDHRVTVRNKVAVPGQQAICWTAYSKRYNSIYLGDAARPNLIVQNPGTGDLRYNVTLPAESVGVTDMVEGGDYLYSLTASPHIAVYQQSSKSGPSLKQFLDLSSLGSSATWNGIAIY